jgi:hypothetical protein
MRRDIYYTAGLYSMLAKSVVCTHAYIYKMRYQGIYIILTTVGRREQYSQEVDSNIDSKVNSKAGSEAGSMVVREGAREAPCQAGH